jgi:sedoheptulokinase
MELRPFLGQGYLHVGATLTAGKAYETLHDLIASILRSAGMDISDEAVFDLMKKEGKNKGIPGALSVDTRFNGSRKDRISRFDRARHLENLTFGNRCLVRSMELLMSCISSDLSRGSVCCC